ncbi:MAG: hypothetical protein GXO99_02440 [Nitrospirae bacterium]|nr:hypothetical protein [Nitrospirota bacterium]
MKGLKYIRTPRPYERLWKNLYVDKNLEDEWLERLNDLKVFNLISICEGHPGNGRFSKGSSPHIYLRMKDKFVAPFSQRFGLISDGLYKKLIELFKDRNTITDIEYRIKFNTTNCKDCPKREVVIHIRARKKRASHNMDNSTRKWFIKKIIAVEKFDSFVESILLNGNQVS